MACTQGEIEKTDELMFNNEEPEPKARRRNPKKLDAASPDKAGKTSEH